MVWFLKQKIFYTRQIFKQHKHRQCSHQVFSATKHHFTHAGASHLLQSDSKQDLRPTLLLPPSLPPHPPSPCTNSSFSLPCAGAAGSAPRCGSAGSVLLSCAVNPIRVQQGHRKKTQREPLHGHMQAGSELARCDPAQLQQPPNRSGATGCPNKSQEALGKDC